MKFFTGWVFAAGMVLATTAAQAQVPAPYEAGRSPYYSVSDIGDPYYAPPRYAPPAQYPPPPAYPGPRYGYGQGPMLLPPTEVYTVLRESGFSPLGIPQQRGLVYTISVIDRGGDDGRLIIDARTGRIIRFIPAHRVGDNFNDDLTMNYGPPGPLPPTHAKGAPWSPKPAPQVASRTVPVPKPSPLAAAAKPAAAVEPAAKPVAAAQPATVEPAAKPAAAAEPVQQSAAAQPKSAEAQTPPPAAVTTGAVPAKPAPQIAPTQDMPNVQGLE
ncbi:hypothetical protein JQ634_25045 [Bradyrhizobium sp. AUGA SZCCT0240]|nr:hypothetical protein [Bradyrhizobium sp. AUGA SZCCT0158]MBR1243890.1 hypothetical protein [Bradyrhizobium sp. AUGA SZCCT0274]MBR1256964.1 hypothetical protein [Bradyrhizobium sp. AUGA SZCCT0240]